MSFRFQRKSEDAENYGKKYFEFMKKNLKRRFSI
nr:MAG TPA: hypothetical protein [Caudoviricetes sp.]